MRGGEALIHLAAAPTVMSGPVGPPGRTGRSPAPRPLSAPEAEMLGLLDNTAGLQHSEEGPMLAPFDLQVIKAAGVTFIESTGGRSSREKTRRATRAAPA